MSFKYWLGLGLVTVSLVYHCMFDFHASVGAQLIGVAILILSFAYVFKLRPGESTPAASPGSGLFRSFAAAWLSVCFLIGLLYLRDIKRIPFWNSEAYVIQDAKQIIQGTLLHPSGMSGDFPSNFMSWPVAAVYALTLDAKLSVRLVGVLAVFACALLLLQITGLLVREKPSRWLVVLPLLSIWSLYLANRGDNNWLSAIPVLVAAQLYYLILAADQSSRRALLNLAVCSALGFWTLYLPFAFSLIVMVLVMLMPRGRFPWKWKLEYLLCFLLLIAPAIGRIVQYPGPSLGRHKIFLLKEGEGTASGGYLEGYWKTCKIILGDFVPDLKHINALGWGVTLEYSTVVLGLLGFVLGWFLLSPLCRRIVYASFILAFFAIVLSNPVGSMWRETLLYPYCFLFAMLGLQALGSMFRKLPRSLPAGWAVGSALVIHAFVFAHFYHTYRSSRVDPPLATGEWVANYVYEAARPYLQAGWTLVYPTGQNMNLIQALAPFPVKLSEYRDPGEFAQKLSSRPSILAVISRPGEVDGHSVLKEFLNGRWQFKRREIPSARVVVSLFLNQA